VQREISEETGVQAEVKGLDGIEIDDACFYSMDEINKLPLLQSLSQLVILSALQGKSTVLPVYPHPEIPLSEGLLCAGDDVQDEFSQIFHLLWYSPKVDGDTIN
jgi:hypothetical protein